MLRINHKAVKAKALHWICENADFTGYEDFASVDCSDPHAVCAALLSICQAEKFYSTYPTPGAMLEDWCMGLPSALDTAAYLYRPGARDLLCGWLEMTDEEKTHYCEYDCAVTLNRIIVREILRSA